MKELLYTARAIFAARKVQDFLWGELDGEWNLEEWRRMFRKRVAKIEEIDVNNPHAIVELKKRLLQNAALSIAMMAILEKIIANEDMKVLPNLPQYSKKIEG